MTYGGKRAIEKRATQAVAAPATGARTGGPVAFPRFLRELALIPLKDRILVDGTDQFRVLSGTAIKHLIPKLITLMDGSRTEKQLELAMEGTSPDDIRTATSLLYQWGMIEDGEEQTSPPVTNVETLAFLRRHVGTMRFNRNGDEALQRLRASEVVIFCSGAEVQLNEILKSLLEKSGVGRAVVLDRKSLDAWQSPRKTLSQSVVVCLSLGEEDSEWCARLDEFCAESQIPWLRVTLDQRRGRADIGPLFDPRRFPCYRCFREVQNDAPRAAGEPAIDAGDTYFLAAMAAVEIVYLLSRIGPLVTGSGFRRYYLQNWNSQTLSWPRVPGCSRCRPLAPLQDKQASRLLLYEGVIFEDYMGLGSHSPASVKERREHVKVGAALSLQAKRLSNCSQLALPPLLRLRLQQPALDVLSGSTGKPAPRFGLEELATILMLTAGIRGHETNGKDVRRWPATAGNLGSVELFLAVRNLEGLTPGLYFYQPWEHSLASVLWRRQRLDIDDFIRRAIRPVEQRVPDVLVILTGAFHRVAHKYGSFGYRLLNFDAGVALSQLKLVTRSLGFHSEVPNRWADDLIEETLKLECEEEQSTAVVALSAKQNGGTISAPKLSDPELQSDVSPSICAPHDFGELPLESVRSMVYRHSRLKEDELRFGYGTVPLELRTAETGLPNISLPTPARGGRSVGAILAARTSIRSYSRDPVTLSQLSAMLEYAYLGDVDDWPVEHRAALTLGFLALAWRVDGLSAGVYAYDRESHGLRFSARAPSSEETCELFLQKEFASAPLCIWIFGNLAAASARHGAFGHRQLLLRAGAASHRLWIAALAMGLEGCIVAGVNPCAAWKRIALDGYRKTSLLTFVAGYRRDRLGDTLPEACL